MRRAALTARREMSIATSVRPAGSIPDEDSAVPQPASTKTPLFWKYSSAKARTARLRREVRTRDAIRPNRELRSESAAQWRSQTRASSRATPSGAAIGASAPSGHARLHDVARASPRLVEVAPEVLADHPHHEELRARHDEEDDHERCPALHLEVESEVREDDEHGVEEAGGGHEEAEDGSRANRDVRERDERVDEVFHFAS